MSIAFVRLANGQIVSGPAVMDFGPQPLGSAPLPPTSGSVRFNILQATGLSGGFMDFGPDPRALTGTIQFNLLQNAGMFGGLIDFGRQQGSSFTPPITASMQFDLMRVAGLFGGFIDFGYNLMRGVAPPPTAGIAEYTYFARRRLRR